MGKTNAVRLLDAQKIAHKTYEYSAPEGFLDGVSVARSTGFPLEQVFKTLLVRGGSGEPCVCIIPVAEELDLKKAARHFGEKKLEMLPSRELTAVTGYIKGGCSPVGMKKLFRTALDESALGQKTIVVSAGKVGLQMELAPEDLCRVTKAGVCPLTLD
ncbi:MAG: Cys-tRNA(Pro) deacylase [Bacillota bacterium]|nr:Cys-tRNA(Pro) deacylase [Bacillota bacterium]